MDLSHLLDDFSRLLSDFNRVPPSPELEETIFEIAGYPHYENVASNILKFFIDPKQNHGLGTLVLESLLRASHQPVSESDPQDIAVTREEPTESGRLDLFVVTTSLVVGVENKLFHDVNNPFAEYAKFVQKSAEESGREPVLLLLALNEPPSNLPLAGFRLVTYERFFDQLLDSIGRILPATNIRYVTYLMDFVSTIKNLRGRPQMLDPIRNFIVRNADTAAEFERRLNELKLDMKKKLAAVSDQVNLSADASLYDVAGPRPYDDDWFIWLALCHFWEIKIPNQKNLAVDVFLSPNEWDVVAFRRQRNGFSAQEDISDFLAARGIQFTRKELYDRRAVCFTFPYESDPTEIARNVQGLIETLRHQAG